VAATSTPSEFFSITIPEDDSMILHLPRSRGTKLEKLSARQPNRMSNGLKYLQPMLYAKNVIPLENR
jgi:hypothetical protein